MGTRFVQSSDLTTHPPDSQLEAMHHGLLAECELAAISCHLDLCTFCCGRMSDLASLDNSLSWMRRRKALPASRTVVDSPKGNGPNAAATRSDSKSPQEITTPQRLGNYEILAEVGRGGMGVVYKAMQRNLQRLVAVKTILTHDHASVEQSVRFQREAELAARVSHPHVVKVLEVSSDAGRPFLAMEWVEGISLNQLIDGKPVGIREAALLVESLAHAVQFAHGQGILHRDLKPSNVMMEYADARQAQDGMPGLSISVGGRNYIPKITDFGLAKLLQGDSALTLPGSILGTPETMAPEMAFDSHGVVGPASDVYSLGVILYWLLTGHPPFRAETPLATLKLVSMQEPTRPSLHNASVPRDLELICLHCLRKTPQERYATAGELAEDLSRFIRGMPIRVRQTGTLERFTRWCRRNPHEAGLAAACVSLLLIGTAVSSWGWWTANLRRRDVEQREGDLVIQKTATARQLAIANENLFTANLAQIDNLYEREPIRALHLLESDSFCPPSQRDAAWRFYKRACSAWLPTTLGHGAEHPDIPGRFDSVLSVAYSPDGGTFVTAGYDRIARIWDDKTRKELRTLQGHDSFVTDVCFSADGSRLATASDDGTARLWDAATGKMLHIFRHARRVNAVRMSPDGRTLATGDQEPTVKLWDLVSPKSINDRPETVLPSQGSLITAIRFNPAGSMLASSSANGRVFLWDMTAVGLTKPRAVLQHASQVNTIAFNADGSLLATGGHDPVQLWDTARGERLAALPVAEYRPRALVFSPDGQTLATGDQENRIRLWNVPTRQLRTLLPADASHGYVNGLAFHPSGERLVSGHGVGQINLWTMRNAAAILTLEGFTRMRGRSLDFSPDGNTLATRIAGGGICLLDVASELGRTVPRVPRRCLELSQDLDPDFARAVPGMPRKQEVEDCWDLWFASDGEQLVISTKLRLTHWDLAAGRSQNRFLREFEEFRTWLGVCATSDDGSMCASAAPGESVRIWNVRTKQLLYTLRPRHPLTGADYVTNRMRFSPDGAMLAIPFEGGVELWTLATQTSRWIPGRMDTSWACAWDHDGQVLALGIGNGRLHFVDVAAGAIRVAGEDTLVYGRQTPESLIFSMAFCRDGTLATGMFASTIRLWHPATGQPRAILRGHKAPVVAVAFNPSGTMLASVSQDGVLMLWDLSTATK